MNEQSSIMEAFEHTEVMGKRMSRQTVFKVVKFLRDTQTLLALGGWCQSAFAKDIEGKVVGIYDESACAWCATGAFAKASQGYSPTVLKYAHWHVLQAIREGYHVPAPHGMTYFNDHVAVRTQDVIEMLDTAIEMVRLRERLPNE